LVSPPANYGRCWPAKIAISPCQKMEISMPKCSMYILVYYHYTINYLQYWVIYGGIVGTSASIMISARARRGVTRAWRLLARRGRGFLAGWFPSHNLGWKMLLCNRLT
jgi:hypothetical protein